MGEMNYYRKPLASRRKSGIVPLKIADSNFLKSDPSDDEDDENKGASPTPSATSLSSLLREKLHSVRHHFNNSILTYEGNNGALPTS